MKHLIILFFALLTVSITAQEKVLEVAEATPVNIEESTVNWVGTKVLGEHSGTIGVQSGELLIINGNLEGGSITMDMNSIKCTDLEGEGAGKLEGHLKSTDFFGVEAYPTATLVITHVHPKGTPGDYKVVGDLTIKTTTQRIKFYANLSDNVATADITVDRTDFDVSYGSGSFFDNLGDKTIYDEFELKVKLVY